MVLHDGRWVVLALVAALAMTGIGYAAFSSSVSLRGTASVGEVQFSIESLQFQGTVPSGVGLSNSPLPTPEAVTYFSNLARGDSFAVNISVLNTGTLLAKLNGETFALSPDIIACTGSSATVTATNGTFGETFSQSEGFYLVLGIQVGSVAACTTGSLELTLTTSVSGAGV